MRAGRHGGPGPLVAHEVVGVALEVGVDDLRGPGGGRRQQQQPGGGEPGASAQAAEAGQPPRGAGAGAPRLWGRGTTHGAGSFLVLVLVGCGVRGLPGGAAVGASRGLSFASFVPVLLGAGWSVSAGRRPVAGRRTGPPPASGRAGPRTTPTAHPPPTVCPPTVHRPSTVCPPSRRPRRGRAWYAARWPAPGAGGWNHGHRSSGGRAGAAVFGGCCGATGWPPGSRRRSWPSGRGSAPGRSATWSGGCTAPPTRRPSAGWGRPSA